MNKFYLKLAKIFLIITFIYIFLFIYTYFNFQNEFSDSFKSLKNLNFHEKYSRQLHHVREEQTLNLLFKKAKVEDLLFTEINNLENKKNIVLFQGDSWMQDISFGKKDDLVFLDTMKKIGEEKKIGFVNGAIASYSPSLMNLQIDVLEKDFNIFPNIVVAYINQTDIGDEICRYKKNKIYQNNNLISVYPETDFMGKGWFNYSQNYILSKIYLSNKSKIVKTFQLINFKYKYSISRSSKRFYRKYISNTPEDKIRLKKCYWDEMEQYLINPSKSDIEYFSNTIAKYLDKINKKKHVKKTILISFPTKNHFENSKDGKKYYKFNVSDLIDKVIQNKNNIKHINFTKILLNDKEFDHKNIWLDDNVHLKTSIYNNLFLNKIFNELLLTIN